MATEQTLYSVQYVAYNQIRNGLAIAIVHIAIHVITDVKCAIIYISYSHAYYVIKHDVLI